MPADFQRPTYWPEIRVLLFGAMAIFLYTIGIGILNGMDIVDFDQRRILGHVHGGTLGWLTLSIFAASLWLFGGNRPVSQQGHTRMMGLSAVAIAVFAVYIVAFSTTYGNFRPIMGTIATAVIALYFLWILLQVPRVELGVPHWGFLAAMATSVVGGVLGVLLALEIATGDNYLPEGGEDAHPATMVVGFLFPVALGMAEWAFTFPTPPRATRAGIIQMVFPFLGGVVLMLALLLEIDPLAPVAILLEVIGVVIFLVRMRRHFRTVDFMTANAGRLAVLSAVGSVFVIGLAQYFVIRYEGDFDLVPINHLLALDHAQFIGSTTNAIFAMLFAATAFRGIDSRWHHLAFVLVNVGIAGFVVSLLGDWTIGKRVFAPAMGTGLLIGLGVFAYALLPGVSEDTVAEPQGAPGQ